MTEKSGFVLEGIDYAYGPTQALQNLDLSIPGGKFYGIVGPNGCGKSTLLDILAGCKLPAQGTVSFAGRSVSSYRRRDLSRQVALVPQDFAIGFAFTVQEVVLMGRNPYMQRFAAPTADDMRIVYEAMAAMGIDHFRDRFVNELSGGEKQRVVVARALAQRTHFLLFDEATSNLDVQHTLQIMNVARDLVRKQQKTVIAVIHNLNLAAAFCDEMIFMKKGRIVKKGPTGEILQPGIIQNVFGVECEVQKDLFNDIHQISFRYWS
jgi:iron complex transport system ATP-binding protein